MMDEQASDREDFERLISAELDGEIDAADMALLQQKLGEDSELRKLRDEAQTLRSLFAEDRNALPGPQSGFADRVMDQVESAPSAPRLVSSPTRSSSFGLRLAGAAAALVLVAGASFLAGRDSVEAKQDESPAVVVPEGIETGAWQDHLESYEKAKAALEEEHRKSNAQLYERFLGDEAVEALRQR